MNLNLRHHLLFACFLFLAVTPVFGQNNNYDYIKVKAPFKMPKIPVFRFPEKVFDITDYGAIHDVERQHQIKANTKAIKAAMDECSKAGWGRVVVPAGEWWCGPVHFQSNCMLYLQEGAVLRFSDNPQNYLPPVEVSWEGLECMNSHEIIKTNLQKYPLFSQQMNV